MLTAVTRRSSGSFVGCGGVVRRNPAGSFRLERDRLRRFSGSRSFSKVVYLERRAGVMLRASSQSDIDCVRRRRREVLASTNVQGVQATCPEATEATVQARVLVDRFRREVLPPKWKRVFRRSA
jgi:hypothetical protein